jgi:hypothetical protein
MSCRPERACDAVYVKRLAEFRHVYILGDRSQHFGLVRFPQISQCEFLCGRCHIDRRDLQAQFLAVIGVIREPIDMVGVSVRYNDGFEIRETIF